MARHRGFTRAKFLGAIPDELKRKYFTSRNLQTPESDLDEATVNEFLGKLEGKVRAGVDEEFHCINDIADRGMDCLERVYSKYKLVLDDKWSREHAAMLLFLHPSGAFREAYDLYLWRAVANTMSHHQLPEDVTASFDDDRLAAFRGSVEAYSDMRHRGKACKLRYYFENGVHVVLVGRGDYMQTQQIIQDDGNEGIQFFRPLKEDVLLYDPAKRVVSIKTSGKGSGDREEYMASFVRSILVDPPENLTLGAATVSLQPIKDGSFRYQGNESIQWVRLVAVQARAYGATTSRVDLSSSNVLTTLKSDVTCLRLSDCELLSAKLKFKLQGEAMSARPITVEIRPPERTSLNKRRDADVVEAYLREQGVLLA